MQDLLAEKVSDLHVRRHPARWVKLNRQRLHQIGSLQSYDTAYFRIVKGQLDLRLPVQCGEGGLPGIKQVSGNAAPGASDLSVAQVFLDLVVL